MGIIENLLTRLQAVYPELVKLRRDLNMYPELSFQEVNTLQKFYADYREDIPFFGLKLSF